MHISKLLVRCLQIVFLIFATLAVAFHASAQNNTSLDVFLTDPGLGAVTNASVTLDNTSSSGAPKKSPASGNSYHFDVSPGTYRLTIAHPSLRRVERELTLNAGEYRELRLVLQLEPLAQNVLVSAEPIPIPATAASQPASVVGSDELQRRQFTQIGSVLSTLPGITVAQTDSGGGITSLFVDGGNSNFTKVLVDGVTLNEPGGAIDLSNFTLENVDKIEVVRGAQSALVGSDAMTGVVEVLTHQGSTRIPQLLLEGDGGTFSTGHGTARLSGLAGPLDYSAAAGYFTTAGQQVNNRYINRTLSGNFGVKLNEQNSLRLTLRNNTSDAGAPGQTVFTPTNLDQHDALRNFTAGLAWEGSTGEHWQHRLSGSETYVRQLFENPLSDFFTVPDPFGFCSPRSASAVRSTFCDSPYHTANQFNRTGFQAQTSYLAAQGSLTAGYFYEVENASSTSLAGHVRRNNQAGFISARWQPLARLSVNAGFRVEANDSFGRKVVPRAGAALTVRNGNDLWGATRLRFAFGLGIKEPSLVQSFSTDPFFLGNPNLRPERSQTFSGGVEQQFWSNRIVFSADYFENRFHDIISFGASTFFNTDLARARGVNISAEARVNSHLSITTNYTLDETRVLRAPNVFDSAETPGNRLLHRPVHSGNVVVNGSLGRVDATLIARFVGRRTDSDFLFPPLGLTSNPGFGVVNLAGSFRLNRRASAIARVENLFDKQYQEVLGYPAFGRAAYVGVRLTFGGE